MPRADPNAGAATLQDIERYMTQVKGLITQYKICVDKLTLLKKNKKKLDEKMNLLTQREGLKQEFIDKKKLIRSLIEYIKNDQGNAALAALKERDFKELQNAWREINEEFVALGMLVEKEELMAGATATRADDPSRLNNGQLLDRAFDIQVGTTNKLKEAHAQLQATKETALVTAATLEQDREKMARISTGLDDVESELAISQKLITNVVKRIATDKVIIAFVFLIVAGVVGIIVYSTLNPDQKIFSVPDAVKPDIPGITNAILGASTTPSPSPSPF